VLDESRRWTMRASRSIALSFLFSFLLTLPVLAQERRAPEVENQFARLQLHGDAMAFHLGEGDDPTVFDHYQGIARFNGPDGTPYIILTRSWNPRPGELLVVEMASRDKHGERLRSNLLERGVEMKDTVPPYEDRGVSHIHFNGQNGWPKFSHPGGPQLVGDVLVVPLEVHCYLDYGGGLDECEWDPLTQLPALENVGALTLIDLSDPMSPFPLLTKEFDEDELDKIGVVGVVHVGAAEHPEYGERYLFILTWGNSSEVRFAWSDSDDLRQTQDLVLEDFTWHEDHLGSDKDKWRNWQTLNFVRDTEGSLYLIGAEKAAGSSGEDWVGLFKVEVGKLTAEQYRQAISYVDEKHLYLNDPNMGSLDAASGVYVSPSGQLILYTGPHDNDSPGGSVEMGEFRNIDVYHSGTTARDSMCPWVELYEDERGWADGSPDRSLMLDFKDRALEDWDDLDEEGFGDEADSLRWYLAPGQKLHLFEDAHHSYSDRVLELEGDGAVHSIEILNDEPVEGDGFGDEIDSVKMFPFADPGGPYNGNEGSPIPLNSANRCYRDGDATFNWTVDSPLCTFSDPNLRQPVLTCADNGSFTISLTVAEDGDSVTAHTTVIVANVAPTIIAITAPTEIEENDLIALVVRFEDPGVLDTHTLSVDWGDGASETLPVSPGAREIVANHRYEDDNPTGTPSDIYTLSVFVTDKDGASSETHERALTVHNVAPEVSLDSLTDEHGSVIGVTVPVALVDLEITAWGSFTDVGPKDTHAAAYHWGDGTYDTGIHFDVFIDCLAGQIGKAVDSHVYGETGRYEIALSVIDDDTGAAAAATHLCVVNAADATLVVVEILRAHLDDPGLSPRARSDLGKALAALEGNNQGKARNGALDALLAGRYNEALVKVLQTIRWMGQAEASEPGLDLAHARALLALSAKSVVVDIISQAEAAARSRNHRRKVAQARSLVDAGDGRALAGDHAGAVGLYGRALREVQGLVGPQEGLDLGAGCEEGAPGGDPGGGGETGTGGGSDAGSGGGDPDAGSSKHKGRPRRGGKRGKGS
jgi:hypothetical protein